MTKHKLTALIFCLLSAYKANSFLNQNDNAAAVFCSLFTGIILGYVLFSEDKKPPDQPIVRQPFVFK